jgi:hypothetical protein
MLGKAGILLEHPIGRQSPFRSRSFPLHATRSWRRRWSLPGLRGGARQRRGCPVRPEHRLPQCSSCSGRALGSRQPVASGAPPRPRQSNSPPPDDQALRPEPAAPPAGPPTLQLEGEHRSRDPGPRRPSQPRSTQGLCLPARVAGAPAVRGSSHHPVIPQPRCRPTPLYQAVLRRWMTTTVPARRVTRRRWRGRPCRSAPRVRSYAHQRWRVGDRRRPPRVPASPHWKPGRARRLGVRRSIARRARPPACQRAPSRTTQRRSGEDLASPRRSIRRPPQPLPTARQGRSHRLSRTLDRRPERRSSPPPLQVPLPGRQERAALDRRRRVRWNPLCARQKPQAARRRSPRSMQQARWLRLVPTASTRSLGTQRRVRRWSGRYLTPQCLATRRSWSPRRGPCPYATGPRPVGRRPRSGRAKMRLGPAWRYRETATPETDPPSTTHRPVLVPGRPRARPSRLRVMLPRCRPSPWCPSAATPTSPTYPARVRLRLPDPQVAAAVAVPARPEACSGIHRAALPGPAVLHRAAE